ncbi:hypothetical protein [Bacillus pseudomycoides]|uniref:hypothetical protein n=1 Tax=Bacillus pseudomycoides TaxID=64104 RepID=UPI000BFA9139|nr:hypothetical protein [Bacillus pseudomycoides]PFX41474.1 hypothetical protein COL31_28305 [Bacillus pseudomycoides]PFZ81325.1 hypothetical protein COL69_19620 [Bacillus pseudomycoides]PGE10492.1 hypothetical protein COM51_25795 [Bacillus pseudomycoides]
MALFNEKEMNRGVEKKSEAKTSPELPKQEKKAGRVVKIKGFQEKKEAQSTVAPLKEEEMPVKKKKKNLMQHLGKKKKDVVKKTAKIDEDSGSKGKTKKEKKAKKAKKKEKPPHIKKSIAEVIPIIDMTESGVFEFREEQGFVDILQIQGTDIYSMNEEEAEYAIYHLAHYYQSYQESIKIVSMNFPVSTEPQQRFLLKKIETCQNPLYERFLVQKLKELQYLEWGRTNREYFLFVYGENEFVVKERVESSKRYLQRCIPLLEMEEEKKIEILYKLHNQNSKIGTKK